MSMASSINLYMIGDFFKNLLAYDPETKASNHVETINESKVLLQELRKRMECAQENDTQTTIINLSDTTLDLNYNDYIEASSGSKVFIRLAEGPDDIKFEFEEPFRPILNKIWNDDDTIILVKGKSGSYFPVHLHKENESLIIVKGSAYEKISNLTINEGEVQYTPRFAGHSFNPITDTLGIAILDQYSKPSFYKVTTVITLDDYYENIRGLKAS
jgi:hypothetical protein